MPLDVQEEKFTIDDLSRGVQRKTSRFQARPGEIWDAGNARFNTVIGGVAKALGYAQRNNTLTSTTSTSSSTSTTTTSTSTSSSTSTTTSTSTT